MTRRKRMLLIGTVLLAIAILAITKAGVHIATTQASTTPGLQGTNPLLSATWVERDVSGHVVSTHAAGRYTYLRVVTEEEELWAVIAEPLPDDLEEVTRLRLYASLERYTSKRLGRTFENLHFATLIDPEKTR